jgi:Ca-activated chloride channel family protein
LLKMRKPDSCIGCFSLIELPLFILLACASPAAQAVLPQDPQARIALRVEVVNVGITVTDAQGHFAGDLTRENFHVFDNGVEQPLTNFASAEDPAQVLVLVEVGPGVYFLEREHLQAGYSLLRGLAPDDRVALAGYDQAAHAIVDFTTDKKLVADALAGLHYNLGMAQLNLFGSLDTALNWLAPVPGKKAVVLLSTGLDTSAPGYWEKLESKLRAGEVVILPVALGADLRSPAAQPQKSSGKKKKSAAPGPSLDPAALAAFEEADRTLKAIAAATGGQAFFPQKPGDFTAVFSQVASLLRHQYSLGFRPQHDGRVHKIEVRLTGPSDQPILTDQGQPLYRVNHRQAYLSPPAP